MRAIRVHEYGGPEKLQLDELPEPKPGPGEVRIRVEAVGVNFVENYNRTGLYPLALPAVLGSEVAGVVEEIGAGVHHLRPADRVATARAKGAYAEKTLAPAAQVVRLPDDVTTEQGAALILQGLTAHFLACDTFPLKTGNVALVHAAAGGVGLLLTQIAKMRGAVVLAVVGSEQKVALAREAGADEVIVSSREDFAEAARRHTAGRGVDVAYDSVGKATFEGTLNSLRPRGMFVSFGNASGPVPPFSPLTLTQKGSLFFTRPSFGHYCDTQEELERRARELFGWLAEGKLKLRIGATLPLEAAADAQRALESRSTTGKLLLKP